MLKEQAKQLIYIAPALTGGPNNENTTNAIMHEFGEENAIVINSVSTRFAGERKGIKLTVRNYFQNKYYDQLADQAIEKFQDKEDINIFCASGGGEESLRLANALLKRTEMKGKKIHLLYFGIPGFVEKGQGVLRLPDFVKRLTTMYFLQRQLNQQSDFYPLPDEFFKLYPENKFPEDQVKSGSVQIFYEDNEAKREERRQRFFNHYFAGRSDEDKKSANEVLNKYDDQIKTLLHQIQELQNQDEKAKAEKDLESLVKQRAKFVFTEGNKWYVDKAQQYEEEHKGQLKDLPKREQMTKQFSEQFKGLIITSIYFARIAKSVSVGVEKELAKLIRQSKEKQITVDVSFIFAGRDQILKTSDIENMEGRIEEAGIQDAIISRIFLAGLSHEAMDNNAPNFVAAAKQIVF
jgi:hypothetical protein